MRRRITLIGTAFLLLFQIVVTAAPAGRSTEQLSIEAAPFQLSEVRVLEGPFKTAQDLDAAYMLSLDPDRLLHVFRLSAGWPTSAQALGGWEAPKSELRGHFVGHYLSGCALMYASTGDERFKQRVDRLVI